MIHFMIWHWTIHIITALIFTLIFINKKRVKQGKIHLHKKWIKSLKKILTKITKKVNNSTNKILFQIYHENDFEKLKNKILKDKKKGYKTVIYTFLGNSSNIYGNLSYSISCINAIKMHHKINLIIQISEEDFTKYNGYLTFNFPANVLIQKFNSIKETFATITKLEPDLVVNQIWNIAVTPNKKLPFIFINIHPYQEYLSLTNIHAAFAECLAYNVNQITNIDINEHDIHFLEKIKQTLVLKNESNLQKHKAVYIQHLKQFQEFRKKYKKIVLFAYSGLGYKVENGMAEMRRILSSIPKDYLIIFTIHPAFYADSIEKVLGSLRILNEDLDHNLYGEFHNLNPEIKPLEVLKSEFPNFITEFDLELKKIHKTPECPSITNSIVNDVDFVMCGSKSKISFIAMESNKPIVAYKKTEDKNFSFEVLQLQTEDIANYDFTQNISEIYNKILHFLFTRIMQLPNLQFDLKPERLQEFINYEKQKRENGVCESDFEFYEKEWQTIEQVYNQFKK